MLVSWWLFACGDLDGVCLLLVLLVCCYLCWGVLCLGFVLCLFDLSFLDMILLLLGCVVMLFCFCGLVKCWLRWLFLWLWWLGCFVWFCLIGWWWLFSFCFVGGLLGLNFLFWVGLGGLVGLFLVDLFVLFCFNVGLLWLVLGFVVWGLGGWLTFWVCFMFV